MKLNLDNNLDNKDLNKIKALIINILLLFLVAFNNNNSKIFFTLLDFIKKVEKMATNLTNKLFSNFLFTISNILSNYINFIYAAYNILNILLFILLLTNTCLINSIKL